MRQEDRKIRVSETFRKKDMLLVESEDRVTDNNQFCHYLKDNLQLGINDGKFSQQYLIHFRSVIDY